MAVFQYFRLGRPTPRVFPSGQNLRTLQSPSQPSHQGYPRRTRRGSSPMCPTVRIIRTESNDVPSPRHVENAHHASSTASPGSQLRPSRRHHRLPIRRLEQQRLTAQRRLIRASSSSPGPLSSSSVRVGLHADQPARLHGAVSIIIVFEGVAHGAVLIVHTVASYKGVAKGRKGRKRRPSSQKKKKKNQKKRVR